MFFSQLAAAAADMSVLSVSEHFGRRILYVVFASVRQDKETNVTVPSICTVKATPQAWRPGSRLT